MVQEGGWRIALVIPAYRVERHIADVLRSVPPWVRHVIVVDDASPDGTLGEVQRVAASDDRITILRHERNQGVGGAMVTGLQKALELGVHIAVKVDGDGQMDMEDLPRLLAPLITGRADYAKGNRFRDFKALRRMPPIRRMGNMALSFLAKAATGYWTCFDPTNGFVAIRSEVLAQVPSEKIHRSYFFEISMLAQLYLLGAVVKDVPMPARYGAEVSSLSIRRVLFEFPPRLVAAFVRRILLRHFVYDFNMASLYLLIGVPMCLVGALFGGYEWWNYAHAGIRAPTGTVMIPTLLVILGFQLLLSAAAFDLQSVPSDPLCAGMMPSAQGAQDGTLQRHASSI
ncbi:MAG: glycosyltransferase family 2 protein [Chthonomonadales bacterium]